MPEAEYPVPAHVVTLRDKLNAGAPAEEEGPAAVAANPTGWFTLKGTFTMPGTVPAPATLPAVGPVCTPGGKPVFSERLVVDPSTKGVRDVLVFLYTKTPKAPEWEHESYAASADSDVDFDQKFCVFLSHTMAFRRTQNVKIINSDSIGHNTNIPGATGMTPFNNIIAANSYLLYKTDRPSNEPESVSCSIHPWMAANLIARDNPYFAVTKPDGTFEIANIPAGVPLEFRVWHESTKAVKSATGITINPKKLVPITGKDGETIEWKVELK